MADKRVIDLPVIASISATYKLLVEHDNGDGTFTSSQITAANFFGNQTAGWVYYAGSTGLPTASSAMAFNSTNGVLTLNNAGDPTGALIICTTTATSAAILPPLSHNSSLHIIAPGSDYPGFDMDAFRLRCLIHGYCWGGTAAAPTHTLANYELLRAGGRGGFDDTGTLTRTGTLSAISFFSAQDITSTAQGAWIGLRTTALNTVGGGANDVPPIGVAIAPSGGMVCAANLTTTTVPDQSALLRDPGQGNIQAGVSLMVTGATLADTIALKAPPAMSGQFAITLPAGTTNFSTSGGTSMVVMQTATGGAFTVAQLKQSDVNGQGVAKLWPAADGTSAVQIMKADGVTSVVNVDTANGRIGVGTNASAATPTATVHAFGNIGASGDGASVSITSESYGTAQIPTMVGRKARGTYLSPTSVPSGSAVFNFNGASYDGSAFQNIVQIGFQVDTLNAANDVSGYIEFRTRANGVGASLIAAMRLQKSGGVSIGSGIVATDPGAGNLAVQTDIAAGGRLIETGAAPGIAAGAGAGTTPTVSIAGGPIAGRVTVVTGTLPTGGVAIVTITYATAFPADSFVTLTPGNNNAAALNGLTMVFANGTASAFVITSGGTGLAAATTYIWNYHVVGK